MKKCVVKTSLMIAITCFSLAISLPGQAAANWLASYYETHPMTVAQVDAAYGEPVNIIAMEDGVEKRVYGPKDAMIGYTYFLTRNNLVINRGTMDNTGEKQTAKTVIAPKASGYMASYYKSNPLSAQDLTKDLGTPLETCSYDNGTQKLFYGPAQAEIGFTYYLIKDGMVVDKNVSSVLPNNAEPEKYAGPEPKGLMADYYASHPMSVEELKAKYGEHISNHDYDNGIKKLTFGPEDPELGYTYFLVKDGMVVDKNVTGAN